MNPLTRRQAELEHGAPLIVERRQTRHGHVALAALGRRPRELEITERQVGIERLPVPGGRSPP